MGRKIVSLLLALVFSISIATTAYATGTPQLNITTMDSTYIYSASCSLNISAGGNAVCRATATCAGTINKITISSYLQKYDGGWVTIQHWSENTYSSSASFDESYPVTTGSYRHFCFTYAYIGSTIMESASFTASDTY